MNLKKLERYLRVNLLGLGPRLMKKRIYRAAVSQRLRNTDVEYIKGYFVRGEGESCFITMTFRVIRFGTHKVL